MMMMMVIMRMMIKRYFRKKVLHKGVFQNVCQSQNPVHYCENNVCVRVLQTDPLHSLNPWLKHFWEERKQCYFDGSFRRRDKPAGLCPQDLAGDYIQDTWVPFYIKAVHAFALGLDSAMSDHCGQVSSVRFEMVSMYAAREIDMRFYTASQNCTQCCRWKNSGKAEDKQMEITSRQDCVVYSFVFKARQRKTQYSLALFSKTHRKLYK